MTTTRRGNQRRKRPNDAAPRKPLADRKRSCEGDRLAYRTSSRAGRMILLFARSYLPPARRVRVCERWETVPSFSTVCTARERGASAHLTAVRHTETERANEHTLATRASGDATRRDLARFCAPSGHGAQGAAFPLATASAS